MLDASAGTHLQPLKQASGRVSVTLVPVIFPFARMSLCVCFCVCVCIHRSLYTYIHLHLGCSLPLCRACLPLCRACPLHQLTFPCCHAWDS